MTDPKRNELRKALNTNALRIMDLFDSNPDHEQMTRQPAYRLPPWRPLTPYATPTRLRVRRSPSLRRGKREPVVPPLVVQPDVDDGVDLVLFQDGDKVVVVTALGTDGEEGVCHRALMVCGTAQRVLVLRRTATPLVE
jgi:hypothetical protein